MLTVAVAVLQRIECFGSGPTTVHERAALLGRRGAEPGLALAAGDEAVDVPLLPQAASNEPRLVAPSGNEHRQEHLAAAVPSGS